MSGLPGRSHGSRRMGQRGVFQRLGQVSRPRPRRVRQRLDHLVGVQQGFLKILRGEAPGGPKDGPPSSLRRSQVTSPDLPHRAQRIRCELDTGNMLQTVRIPWFPDPPCIITVAEALVQVAMHSQHHRGQCMTRLKDLGGEPKNVDWIIWLWKQKPAARWS